MRPKDHTQHWWGPAMPGQGRSRICLICGGREAVCSDTPCPGTAEPVDGAMHVSDYDPLEDDA